MRLDKFLAEQSGLTRSRVTKILRDGLVEVNQTIVKSGATKISAADQIVFDGEELHWFIAQASWIAVNDYEGKMLCDRTGWTLAEISQQVRGLIVTLGSEGCEVWERGSKTRVAPVKPAQVVDPTGCGDAWRGGLLYGLEKGWTLVRCAELGNRLGALKIAQRGPQNYQLDFALD